MAETNEGTQTSTSLPWSALKKPLKQVIKKAGNYFDKREGFHYPDFNTSVQMSPQTTAALSGMWNEAQQPNALLGASEGFAGDLIGGGYDIDTSGLKGLLDQAGNPYYQGVVDKEAGRLADDISRQFGGAAWGSADHTDRLARDVGDFRERAMADQYNTGIATQRALLGDIAGAEQQGIANRLAGVGAVSGLDALRYAPYERMAAVGSAYDDQATRDLQAKVDEFNTKDSAKWNRLNSFLGALTGAGGNYGTQTSTVSSPSNPWGMGAGGALLGYQAGGGVGALAGGGLGLLSGLLSEPEAKEDVRKVGKTDDGLAVYTYRYKGEPGPTMMGVMADEVERKKPRAIRRLPGGARAVDYRMVA